MIVSATLYSVLRRMAFGAGKRERWRRGPAAVKVGLCGRNYLGILNLLSYEKCLPSVM